MPSNDDPHSTGVYKLAGLFACSLLLLISIGAPAHDAAVQDRTNARPQLTPCRAVSADELGKPLKEWAASRDLELCSYVSAAGEAQLLLLDRQVNETILLTIDNQSGMFKAPVAVKYGMHRSIDSFQSEPTLREVSADSFATY